MSKLIAISATVSVLALIGGPFELIDQNGATVTDADIITEPTLIWFGFWFCPDFCPLDMTRNTSTVDILAEKFSARHARNRSCIKSV